MNLIAFTFLINVEQIHVKEPVKTFDDISQVIDCTLQDDIFKSPEFLCNLSSFFDIYRTESLVIYKGELAEWLNTRPNIPCTKVINFTYQIDFFH